jgi:hypothetical protein
MTKCDSPDSAELQALAHKTVQKSLAGALVLRGCEETLALPVSQYESSAKTTAGVDATFRDIGKLIQVHSASSASRELIQTFAIAARKLRNSMDIIEYDASLPMQID